MGDTRSFRSVRRMVTPDVKDRLTLYVHRDVKRRVVTLQKHDLVGGLLD